MKTQTKFFSKIVSPISNLEDAKVKGNYTWIYDLMTPEHIQLNQAKLPAKEVFLVPVTETITSDEIVSYLAKQGMKPCENAPEYLLGLMVVTPESELPEELKRKDFVAANSASVFAVSDGSRCFLRVGRLDGYRELSLVGLDGSWDGVSGWVFLAESLESSPKTLEFSDTLTLESELKNAVDICKNAGYVVYKVM